MCFKVYIAVSASIRRACCPASRLTSPICLHPSSCILQRLKTEDHSSNADLWLRVTSDPQRSSITGRRPLAARGEEGGAQVLLRNVVNRIL